MTWSEIDDPDDPRLAVYRDLHRANLTRQSGRFIAESRLLVQRLLASRLQTESILCSDRCRDDLPALADSTVAVYVAPHELVSTVVGFQFHRGMLACGRRPANCSLEQLFVSSDPRPLIVACPRIVDPGNLAGVIRNCCAFGAQGLLLGPQCADAFSRRVARVSMGTVFDLPIRVSPNLAEDLDRLQTNWGFRCVATVLDPTAKVLARAIRPTRLALLFGSEGHGLEPEWIERSDERVTLPMCRGTDSLNVATASGIFLYHYTHVASHQV